MLVYGFVTRDFSIKYVADHSSRDLPLFYTISAFWAGQEGSLLFWLWLLSIFGAIIVWRNRKAKGELANYALLTIAGSELFLALFVTLWSNPFTRFIYQGPPEDGAGLNPLLQNFYMIFHPPTLFIGFAGFTVPFAYALGALIYGKSGNSWISRSRPWTIFSWAFLTLGIVLGAKWAYVELGWGGYWAWDPIENASLFPWLTATAFLHSVMIQERRNMLKIWNIALITLTFELCLFGTFLTRSGILSSVHAFAASKIPFVFIGFIFISSLTIVRFSILRKEQLKSAGRFGALLSRENSFLINGLLLLGLTFATLWGTMYPIISEIFIGKKITVGESFFNLVNRPIGLLLLILTGICPLISWRNNPLTPFIPISKGGRGLSGETTVKNFTKNFVIPLAVAFLGTIISYCLYRNLGIYSLICIFASIFVVITILMELYRGTRSRSKREGANLFHAFCGLVWRNKRRYGGYVVHIGIVLVFIGIMGSTGFRTKSEQSLAQGESFRIGPYNVTYMEPFSKQKRNMNLEGVKLVVTNAGKNVATLMPALAFYPQQHQQPTSELDIYSTFSQDLYASLSEIANDGCVAVTFYITPLVGFIWLGCWIMLAGAIIAVLELVQKFFQGFVTKLFF
jgi:cytochrome c-type biogenesis protein CcmF